MTREQRRREAEEYLGERTGRLEYRFIRYGAVADVLFANGLNDNHLLMDVGAGMCDFDFYLRTVRGWKGRYLPVDASIDGVDLEEAKLPCVADYITCIEVIEHLVNGDSLIAEMIGNARNCVVMTTPNTQELGEDAVLAMDRTHIHPYYGDLLALDFGFNVEVHSFFGMQNDSLLVWRPGVDKSLNSEEGLNHKADVWESHEEYDMFDDLGRY